MARTPILTRQSAQPRDLSARLLSRLYPSEAPAPTAPPMAQGQPQSPTGLPIFTPPPPAPVAAPSASGRMGMAAPASQMNAAAPTPAAQGSETDWMRQQHQNQAAGGMFGQHGFHQIRSDGTKAVDTQYQNLANEWDHEAPIDYSGGAEIGQYYDAARKRAEAQDAAMGRSGGGVGAAGQASLYGQQGSAVASMIRQLLQEKERRHAAELAQLRGFGQQVSLAELQRGWQKQDKPGFFKQLLGVVGDVAGNVIPGLVGGHHGESSGAVNLDPMGLGGSYAQSDPVEEYLRQLSDPATMGGLG